MGKPTGFLEIKREVVTEDAPQARLEHWREFKHHPEDSHFKKQGARCMDCGTPYCHTGITLAGMASGCPINNLIPEFNDLVYRGRWKEALDRLRKTNNFPEFTGRVCPAPCEGSCVLGFNEPPVTIKNIEAAIIDRGWEEGWMVPQLPPRRTGKKVAVVGSGPAGLSAADQLNRAGHYVTVFERADRPGGLLMYGIPNMKLDKDEVVMRRINLMEAEGIKFICGVEIGKDVPMRQLQKDYDAIVLAVGSTVPNNLDKTPGRDAKGIHFAMEFLHQNTKALLDRKVTQYAGAPAQVPISAQGKDVVVIGGGDTGTDCVGTSLRHQCKSVTQLEIMARPPTERAANNPWPEWPRVYKMDYGQEEAAARQGRDPRVYLISTEAFIKDEAGNLTGLQVVDIEWQTGANGRPAIVPKEGTRRVLPAQLCLLALGFRGPESVIAQEIGLKTTDRSNFDAAHGDFKTNIQGVFACGDCRRGQSLVVWAINEGRGCAREVDRFLMGVTQLV